MGLEISRVYNSEISKVKKLEIKTISCSNILKNCNAINAHHTNIDKNKFKSEMICKRCISNDKFLRKKLDVPNYNLNDWINYRDKEKLNYFKKNK